MCSSASQPQPTESPESALAARLAAAIDDVASAARAENDAADSVLAERLAQAWAMIAAADPELAVRAASYSRLPAHESRS
jgi:hypothetical protein